jgi:hypothetical protein
MHALFKNWEVTADELGIERTFGLSGDFGHNVGAKLERRK